jgi:hypothetical protein
MKKTVLVVILIAALLTNTNGIAQAHTLSEKKQAENLVIEYLSPQ